MQSRVQNFEPEDQSIVYAPLRGLRALVPTDLANSIDVASNPASPDALVAVVAMHFPDKLSAMPVGCQMSLGIRPEKVQHLAWTWFGVRLESRAGLRYVCLPGSNSTMQPTEKLTIHGFPCARMDSDFGSPISTAIAACSRYKDEQKMCLTHTDCVFMMISNRSDEGAQITFQMGLFPGTEIRRRLHAYH